MPDISISNIFIASTFLVVGCKRVYRCKCSLQVSYETTWTFLTTITLIVVGRFSHIALDYIIFFHFKKLGVEFQIQDFKFFSSLRVFILEWRKRLCYKYFDTLSTCQYTMTGLEASFLNWDHGVNIIIRPNKNIRYDLSSIETRVALDVTMYSKGQVAGK